MNKCKSMAKGQLQSLLDNPPAPTHKLRELFSKYREVKESIAKRVRDEQVKAIIEDSNLNPWKLAIEESMLLWGMLPKEDETPQMALHRLIMFENQVALDPLVSEGAQQLIEQGRALERSKSK